MSATTEVKLWLRLRGCPDHVIEDGLPGLIQRWVAGSKLPSPSCRGCPAIAFGRSAELNSGRVLFAVKTTGTPREY